MKGGANPLLSLPYPSLIRKRYPFTAGLTESFPVIACRSPASNSQLYGDSKFFLHYNQATLTTRLRLHHFIFYKNELLYTYRYNITCFVLLWLSICRRVLALFLQVEMELRTSYCSFARPAQPGPNWTRLCGPYIAAISGD